MTNAQSVEESTPELLECRECGQIQAAWQDRYCTRCWSPRLGSKPSSGKGVLTTWATYFHGFGLEGFDPPYTVGWVELDEGPRVPCLIASEGEALSSGRQTLVHAVSNVVQAAHSTGSTDELHAYLLRDR